MLHRWLVAEVDKGSGKITKKEIIRGKVGELVRMGKFFTDMFNTGN